MSERPDSITPDDDLAALEPGGGGGPDFATCPEQAWPGFLVGKQAVVTGAGSGIGAAVSRRLAAAGAELTLVDRVADLVVPLAEEIGGNVIAADLADPDNADGIGRNTDILINNAGLQHNAPVHRFPPEMFSRLLTVMLESPFRIIRAALPGMYEQGWGRIINISSVHGLRASSFKSAYVAAKHGLEGLSKTVAIEAAGTGVTSNCVCPGFVRTPLVARQVAEQAELHRVPAEQVVEDVLLARMPIKRLIEPAEVAELVVWLCGPGSTSITGSSFPIDGGWTAH